MELSSPIIRRIGNCHLSFTANHEFFLNETQLHNFQHGLNPFADVCHDNGMRGSELFQISSKSWNPNLPTIFFPQNSDLPGGACCLCFHWVLFLSEWASSFAFIYNQWNSYSLNCVKRIPDGSSNHSLG